MNIVSGAIPMAHDVDPKVELQQALFPFLEDITLIGSEILVATYVRPEKTRGGIVLPGKTRDEDKYQGVSGLIVKMGPLAFVDDATHKFPVPPRVSDWVVYRARETTGIHIGKTHCRLVEDTQVFMIVKRPDIVL